MCLCECVHVSTGAFGGQKRMSDALELETQMVVSCRHGCWNLISAPVEEGQGPLTTELPAQSPSKPILKVQCSAERENTSESHRNRTDDYEREPSTHYHLLHNECTISYH